MSGGGLRRLALLVPLIGGCASVPSELPVTLQSDSAQRDVVSRHAQRAREREAAGALRPALIEWQLVLTVAPGSPEGVREAARLQRLIEERFARERAAAGAAARRSDVATAQQHLLRALALKPDDQEAIDELRRIEGRRAYAAMAAAPVETDAVESEADVYVGPAAQAGDNGQSADAAGRTPIGTRALSAKAAAGPGASGTGGDPGLDTERGLALMARKEYDAALALLQRARDAGGGADLDGYIAEAREGLAERHYQRGVVAFRSARYDQAVSEFEQALQYAPEHHKARFYLSSARELSGN